MAIKLRKPVRRIKTGSDSGGGSHQFRKPCKALTEWLVVPGIAIQFLIIILLSPTMVHAQKVTIDYSKEFDFDSVKTFQYVDTNESNPEDEMMADRVEKMIIAELKGGGLRTVEGDPDIYVTYHLAGQGGVTLDTTSYGYGGSWGGWGGDGGYTSTSSGGGKDPCYAPDCRCPNGLCKESCCEFAMLVVDAYDAKEKKIIWRGEGWVSIESKPNKQTKQIEKILKKLGKKWDIILAGKEK